MQGEMPAGRVDFERIMPLRDTRTLTEDCFTAAATAFMHLTCAGIATCVQRAVHAAATCMDPEQQVRILFGSRFHERPDHTIIGVEQPEHLPWGT